MNILMIKMHGHPNLLLARTLKIVLNKNIKKI